MSVKPVPEDYLATPYLICRNAAEALDWYVRAFNATEVIRLTGHCGKIMHAEFRVGISPVMLADEFPDMGYNGPSLTDRSPVMLLVYLENVDETFDRAVELGANALKTVADQFDGDRRGELVDPYGHVWILASRKEYCSKTEMKARFRKMMETQE